MAGSNWLTRHDLHLLVLSSAGKPVFSLHSDEDDDEGSYLAICSLLCALASKAGNELHQVLGGGKFRLVFRYRGDLLLVAITNNHNHTHSTVPVRILLQQLDLLYAHILFHVTQPALEHLYRSNSAYDLSGLLGGTDPASRSLVKYSQRELAVMWRAIPVLPLASLNSASRARLVQCLEQSRQDCAVFAFLIAKAGPNRPLLVCGLGPPTSHAQRYGGVRHVTDFLLLGNFVLKSSPQSEMMETWMPLCLPEFNNTGHLHCYSSALVAAEGEGEAAASSLLHLVLCTTNASLDQFHLCAQRKRALCAALGGELAALNRLAAAAAASANSSALEMFGANLALHVAVKVGGSQYVEAYGGSAGGASGVFPGPTPEYVAERYANLLFNNTDDDDEDDNDCRLTWDAQVGDAAVLARDREMDILALFPPLTTPAEAQAELVRIRQHTLRNKAAWFSLPDQLMLLPPPPL